MFSIDDEDPTPTELELKEMAVPTRQRTGRAEPDSSDCTYYFQVVILCVTLLAIGGLLSHWTSPAVDPQTAALQQQGHGFAARETNKALKLLHTELASFQEKVDSLGSVMNLAKGVPTHAPTAQPTKYPTAGFREQHLHCPDKCSTQGHCCVGLNSGCQHPSCAMGCAIAQVSNDVSACEKTCDDADSQCVFTHKGVTLQMCAQCPAKCGNTVHDGLCGGNADGNDGCKLGCQIAFEPK